MTSDDTNPYRFRNTVTMFVILLLLVTIGILSYVVVCNPQTLDTSTRVPEKTPTMVVDDPTFVEYMPNGVPLGQFSVVQHRDIPILMERAHNTIISVSTDSFSWSDGNNRHVRKYTVRHTQECVEIEFDTAVMSTKVFHMPEHDEYWSGWKEHQSMLDRLVGSWTVSPTHDDISSTFWLMSTDRTYFESPICLRKVVSAMRITDVEGGATFQFGGHTGNITGIDSTTNPMFPYLQYHFLGLFEVPDEVVTIGGVRTFHIDAYIQEPEVVMGRPVQTIFPGDVYVLPRPIVAENTVGNMVRLVESLAGIDTAGLGTQWLEAAQAEHISILAFLKLGEELMALGCPLHILADVCKAAGDEVRHAQLSLGVAETVDGVSSYNIGPVGIPTIGVADLLRRNAYETAEEEKALITLVEKREIYQSTLLARMYDSIISDEKQHVELGHTISTWLRSQME